MSAYNHYTAQLTTIKNCYFLDVMVLVKENCITMGGIPVTLTLPEKLRNLVHEKTAENIDRQIVGHSQQETVLILDNKLADGEAMIIPNLSGYGKVGSLSKAFTQEQAGEILEIFSRALVAFDQAENLTDIATILQDGLYLWVGVPESVVQAAENHIDLRMVYVLEAFTGLKLSVTDLENNNNNHMIKESLNMIVHYLMDELIYVNRILPSMTHDRAPVSAPVADLFAQHSNSSGFMNYCMNIYRDQGFISFIELFQIFVRCGQNNPEFLSILDEIIKFGHNLDKEFGDYLLIMSETISHNLAIGHRLLNAYDGFKYEILFQEPKMSMAYIALEESLNELNPTSMPVAENNIEEEESVVAENSNCDIYLFSKSQNKKEIHEYAYNCNGSSDHLCFLGTELSETELHREGQDLILTYSQRDSVRLIDYFLYEKKWMGEIQFSDAIIKAADLRTLEIPENNCANDILPSGVIAKAKLPLRLMLMAGENNLEPQKNVESSEVSSMLTAMSIFENKDTVSSSALTDNESTVGSLFMVTSSLIH